MQNITLASTSPRRAELLSQLGLAFTIVASGVAEDENNEKDPVRLAAQLALSKAQAVAAPLDAGVVIAADTIVCIEGQLLGKPQNEYEAAEMLRTLGGRTHQVLTGVAVIRQPRGQTLIHVEITHVTMRTLREEEICWYVGSGEPYDKAGGYGIQGKAAIFVEKVEGCYFNVVGLPLFALSLMLEKVGVRLWGGAEEDDIAAADNQGFTTE
jgi:septum formation protein